MEKPWDKVLSWNFNGPDLKWFLNAKLNITEIFLKEISKNLGIKPQ